MGIKLIFLMIIGLISTSNSYAFDFHGVRSGMSEDEVSAIMKKLGGKKSIVDSSWRVDGLAEVEPSSIYPRYNHDMKLYQIELKYYPTDFGPKDDAIRIVLKKKYGAELSVEDDTTVAIITDEALYSASVKYYTKIFMKDL